MSKQGMYEIVESFKKLGKALKDELTGETVSQSIKEELNKHRALSPKPVREPLIILESLRANNKLKSYGLQVDDLDNILRQYGEGKIKI